MSLSWDSLAGLTECPAEEYRVTMDSPKPTTQERETRSRRCLFAFLPRQRRTLQAVPCLAILFAALANWSWRKWPDVLIDFGQQLYIPWRLCEGDVLFRDIHHIYGPFSQLFNAGVFRLFGVSFSSLIAVNLAWTALTAILLYQLLSRAADRLTAEAGTVLFLTVFAFSQYVPNGNYNFIAPYAHELTHGLAVSLGMLLLLAAALRHPNPAVCLSAGLCLGITLLTKAEIVLASVPTAGLWAIMFTTTSGLPWKGRLRALLLVAGGTVAPVMIVVLYLSQALPLGDAARGALNTVFLPLTRDITSNAFHQWNMGTDQTVPNLIRACTRSLFVTGVVSALGATAWLLSRTERKWRPTLSVLGGSTIAVLAYRLHWNQFGHAVGLVCAGCAAFSAYTFWSGKSSSPDVRQKHGAFLLLAVFGLFLLTKIALNTRLFHYGFVLALPATMAVWAGCTHLAPNALPMTARPLFRALLIGALAACCSKHLYTANSFYQNKTLSIGNEGDSFYTYGAGMDARSVHMPTCLARLRQLPEGTTVLMLPDGILYNYLSRRRSPSPHMNFMMTEVLAFGEDRMLGELQQDPPDVVVLVQRRTDGFGVPPFGTDSRYGKQIMDWLRERYECAQLLGHQPLVDGRFGVAFLVQPGSAAAAVFERPPPTPVQPSSP